MLMAACLAGAAYPAQADWQYTKWDMTPDAVVAASQGKAHLQTAGENQRVWELDQGAEANYADGDFALVAKFYFDKAGKLKAVTLTEADSGQCDTYRAHVEQVMGKALEQHALGNNLLFTEHWYDKANDNFIRLNVAKTLFCFTAYAPLDSIDADNVPHFK